MFLLTGEGKYIDVLERSLYNNVISGVSYSGDRFFYPNPLESDGMTPFNHGLATRQEWFPCACCPSNVSRILPSVPGYFYATRGDTVYVNLYAQSKAEIPLDHQLINIEQITDYPINGDISIKVNTSSNLPLVMAIRIPGWSVNQPLPGDLYQYVGDTASEKPQVSLNNKKIDEPVLRGYIHINKVWREDDEIKIILPMQIHRVVSHDSISENHQKVALEKGPLVYCFEETDNLIDFEELMVTDFSTFDTGFDRNLLGGTNLIYVDDKDHFFTALPYHKWSNRGENKMKVWVPYITGQ
jgi:DUF1680 family protein